MTKFTFTIDLTDEQVRHVLENSIERVMNNAIKVGQRAQEDLATEDAREDASTLWQDCQELKQTNRLIWDATRNAIFEAGRTKS